MSLSDTEIQSLRFHLGYGNISANAYPYTPDGFLELFASVVAPNLQSGFATTTSTAVATVGVASITVAAIGTIAARTRLVVDVGEDAEIVDVKNVSGLVVTARFAKEHAGTYPVSELSGESRLRLLLADADKAWQTAQSSDITGTAGLKQLGKGEIEWFPGGQVLAETNAHYCSIQDSIAALVRVRPHRVARGNGRCVALSS